MATMSTDKNKPKPNAPAAAEKPVVAEELPFDVQLQIFWEKYQKQVTVTVCVAVILASVVSLAMWWIEHKRNEQGLALSNAKEAKDFQAVSEKFRGENVGAYALLLLADELYQKGDYEKCANTYQRFLDEYPKHPLAGSAVYGKGTARENLGDYNGASNSYQLALQQYGGDIHAPDVRMGLARCEEALGQTAKARQTYEDVVANLPGTMWAQQASRRITVLDRDNRAKGGPSLAPAPAAANLPAGLLPTTPATPTIPAAPAKK